VYANYLRTCAMLNVEPVSRERAHDLIGEWNRAIAAASATPPPAQH
jgi:hypothetical protein